MLTVQDMQNLLAIIVSDRLTLRGNEAAGIADLQRKLAAVIEAAKQPSKDQDGDGARPTE
jgi:hypothetical protein